MTELTKEEIIDRIWQRWSGTNPVATFGPCATTGCKQSAKGGNGGLCIDCLQAALAEYVGEPRASRFVNAVKAAKLAEAACWEADDNA